MTTRTLENYRLNVDFLGFEKGTELLRFEQPNKDEVFRIFDKVNKVEITKDVLEQNIPSVFVTDEDYIRNEERKRILQIVKNEMIAEQTLSETKNDDCISLLNDLYDQIKGETKK